jgi:Na+/melibiose symporter-like transporter
LTPAKNPTILVLGLLSVSIGFPFLVVSSGGPLLQKWFGYCRHRASSDPYFLSIASNCGSLVALLAYPIALDRHLTLTEQNHLWFLTYIVLVILLALCILLYLRPLTNVSGSLSSTGVVPGSGTQMPSDDRTEPSIGRRLRWLLWSSIPASLLSGVTSYITTDIIAAPLFWVIPLALYLLSFIFAFARPAWTISPFLLRRQAFLLLGAALTVAVHATNPEFLILPLHLLAFFATATVCHGRLASDRPPVAHLTSFYLWIAFGGLL